MILPEKLGIARNRLLSLASAIDMKAINLDGMVMYVSSIEARGIVGASVFQTCRGLLLDMLED